MPLWGLRPMVGDLSIGGGGLSGGRLVDPGQLGPPAPSTPQLMAEHPLPGAGLIPTTHYTEQATEICVQPPGPSAPPSSPHISTEGPHIRARMWTPLSSGLRVPPGLKGAAALLVWPTLVFSIPEATFLCLSCF